MPIICFFGADGSGKSTLARALAKMLNQEGFTVRLSWMRGTHTFSSLLARLLSDLNSFKGSDNPYYEIAIPRSLRKPWHFIEFTSMLPVLLARFVLPNILGYTVVAERYIPDFIVWVAITTKDPNYQESLTARFLKAFTIKAEARIYLTAELATLLKRRGDVNSQFLQNQLKLYEEMARSVNAFKLDTTDRSIEESLNILFNLVKDML